MPGCLVRRLLLVVLLYAAAANAWAARASYDRVAPADKLFTDVMLDLEYRIGEHNFALVGRNEIGRAIQRRGHADFGDAAIVHFCNLEYARRAMDIDPSLILYMPCRIAVYEDDDRIHAASLLLPLDTPYPAFNAMAREVNAKIRDIIDYAVAPNAPAPTR